MAEAFARVLGGDRIEVASSGLAASSIDALTIIAMDEVGIDIRD
jgi:protein-tyrosine-phosphatase